MSKSDNRLSNMNNNVLDNIIKEFNENNLTFQQLRTKVETLLNELLVHQQDKIQTISSRIKKIDSLTDKVKRKKDKYSSLKDITDIIGFRVITLYVDTVDEVAQIIESEFKIDRQNSIDKRKTLDPSSFGYLSLHYVASLSDNRLSLPEYKNYSDFRFEIQIRSILQHTWAEIEHELGYKSKNSIPQLIQRRFSRLAGLLELADEEFKQIRDTIKDYRNQAENEDIISKNVMIDQELIRIFLHTEPLIKEINSLIAEQLRLPLYNNLSKDDYSDIIERLIAVELTTIEQIKQYLEQYKNQIIKFAVKWINKRAYGYLSSDVSLVHLCYVKLALKNNVDDIVNVLKSLPLNISSEGEFQTLAQRILQIYEEIK